MMDMEMNAGLGDDDMSTTSEAASSDRSSASGTLCDFEKDLTKIISEMKEKPELAPYEIEYRRLYEALYRGHQTQQNLTEERDTLKDVLEENTKELANLREKADSDLAEITRLKEEVLNSMKMADAAHTREQNAQEVIENLRLTMSKLNVELEHKNKELAAQEEMSSSKQKEAQMKEKEKLLGEIDTMRERMKFMSQYIEELDKKTIAGDKKLGQMQEILDGHLNELSRERRAKEKIEADLQMSQEEATNKNNDLQAANASLRNVTATLAKTQTALKEEKMTTERMQKDINKLVMKKSCIQADLDNANVQMEEFEKEVTDKDKQLKTTKHDLFKLKEEYTKVRLEKDIADKKIMKVQSDRSKLEQDIKQHQINYKNLERESLSLRKQQFEEKQNYVALMREKNILIQSKENMSSQMKKVNRQLVLTDRSMRKLERELDTALDISMELRKQVDTLTKERDKASLEVKRLAEQVEDYIGEVKLKQVEIFDYKKRMAEADVKYRQQQNLFETVRAERNAYRKSVVEAQDEIVELKEKMRIFDQQVEQMKEDVSMKEAALVKGEFLLSRVEKEKEAMKIELQNARDKMAELRHELEGMKQEAKNLRQTIMRADMEISKQTKSIENVLHERDVIGTQLVRRNDEITLLYSKIKTLTGILQRGEAQYSQRLEDIRLLKLEVHKLRNEKALLTKSINNVGDLRQELFHLDRDLAQERLKITALEAEVQTPLNVHRWRKLEGTDPSQYELLKKNQILQKRVLRMAAQIIVRDRKIKDTEKMHRNLRDEVAKQRFPEVTILLSKTQTALRERGKQMKCLVAELNMYEVQLSEYKFDMEQMENEMRKLKGKYYTQKRKLQLPKCVSAEPILPPVSPYRKKFCGGGFNMTVSAVACREQDSENR